MIVTRSLLVYLAVGSLLAGAFPHAWAGEVEPTIVVYTRHTFRGVTAEMPPGTIEIPQIGLTYELPALSYEMNATEGGLAIARQDYPQALESGVRAALDAIGEKRDFGNRWDSIRADLATQRTYETALHIKRGLGGNVPLTGCPTRGSEVSDPVTSADWIRAALGEKAMQSLPLPAKGEARVQASAEAFVQSLQKVLTGKESQIELPPLRNGTAKTPLFESLSLLAQSMEMVATKGPPISLLLGKPAENEDVAGVIAAGLSLTAANWYMIFPGQTADLAAWPTLAYVGSLPAGRHEILVGHDEQLFCIKQSLGLVEFEKDPTTARIYPMETAIFVKNADRVALVGLRLLYEKNGQTLGKFGHRVFWQGSLQEWESRVEAVKQRIASSPATAPYLDKPLPAATEIRILE